MKKPIITSLDTEVFCDREKFNKAYEFVSDERKRKIDALRLENDKRLSLGSGYLLEKELRNLGIEKFAYEYGEHKKPYLISEKELFFSLSHSGSMAVCAIYEKEVGIDIEKVRDVADSVIEKVCTKYEYDLLSKLEKERKHEQFIRLWTAKESYMKYLGRGLGISPKDIEVTFGENINLLYKEKYAKVNIEEIAIDGYFLTLCYEI